MPFKRQCLVVGEKWYFFPQIVLSYSEKKKFSNWQEVLKETEVREFAKFLRLTRTIDLDSEKSEYLKHNAFLTCCWRFLRPNTFEELELKLKKITGILKLCSCSVLFWSFNEYFFGQQCAAKESVDSQHIYKFCFVRRQKKWTLLNVFVSQFFLHFSKSQKFFPILIIIVLIDYKLQIVVTFHCLNKLF